MQLYTLLDASRLDGLIYQARELNEQHRCLYEGDSEVVLGAVAPWLFQLESQSYFAQWLVEHGAGESWGVFLHSSVEEEELYRHLRQFLIVHQEDGKELYFRFYDPRVLRNFLPTCDVGQLQEFFGPVNTYVMEDAEGKVVTFEIQESKLIQRDLNVDLETYLKSPEKTEEKFILTSEESDKNDDKNERWNFGF